MIILHFYLILLCQLVLICIIRHSRSIFPTHILGVLLRYCRKKIIFTALHKTVIFSGQITLSKIFFKIIMQKYALFIFFIFLWNIRSFLRPKHFFSEILIFALSNKV